MISEDDELTMEDGMVAGSPAEVLKLDNMDVTLELDDATPENMRGSFAKQDDKRVLVG